MYVCHYSFYSSLSERSSIFGFEVISRFDFPRHITSMAKNNWFDVDKEGLAKLLERRGGKSFVVFELIQNAWDENSTRVDVTLTPIANRAACEIIVTDDNPSGFSDLSHSFTLFAESKKKGDPEKRGRFNLGEKLVLACCEEATIASTTGSVTFDIDGNRQWRKSGKTETGSRFSGVLRMTRSEYEEVCKSITCLFPPPKIDTFFNGVELQRRGCVARFEATLATEDQDTEGRLIRTSRKTMVTVYDVHEGETASIYEMGIPVVETGDKYHVDIEQKVPVNFERENVPPSYLRSVRTAVLNHTSSLIKGEAEANATWVRDAIEDKNCSAIAIKRVVTERFGKDAVIYDPSDPEGSKISMSMGRTVIPGGAFSSGAWNNIKQHNTVLPAGQVTPSPKPYSEGGKPLNLIDRSKWTEGMLLVESFARMLGKELMGVSVRVTMAKEFSWPYGATYGKGGDLTFNAGRLGNAFFDEFPQNFVKVARLIIHEFGHEYSSDHFSSEYHEALCKLGAKLGLLALEKPELFSRFTNTVVA